MLKRPGKRIGLLMTSVLGAGMLLLAVPAPAQTRAAPQGVVDLSPKLATGDPVRFDCRVESDMRFTIGGLGEQVTRADKDARISVKVVETLPGGGGVVELTHDAIQIEIENALITGSFDSTQPVSADTGNDLAAIVRPMVGKKLTLHIDPDGTIRSVSGIDAMAPAGMAGAIFEQLFGEQAIRNMYQPLFSVGKNPPTAEIGESWQTTRAENTSMGMLATTCDLKLVEVKQDVARIDISGELGVELGTDPGMTKVHDTKIKGVCEWDTRAGMMRSIDTESLLHAESNTTGLTVSVKVESRSELKRAE